jgi:hypothetical protein
LLPPGSAPDAVEGLEPAEQAVAIDARCHVASV